MSEKGEGTWYRSNLPEIDYNKEYQGRQQALKDAGFTPYNCDELDEFPNMNRPR